MKYCGHCGAELLDEAVICPKCGCPVGGANNMYAKSKSNSWNALAVAGFVLSFFMAIVGLILSIVACKQIRDSGEKGKGLAIAGIVISSIIMAILTFYLVCWLLIYMGFFLIFAPLFFAMFI